MKRIAFVLLFILCATSVSVASEKKKKDLPPSPLEEFLTRARQASASVAPSAQSLFSPTNPNLFLFHDLKAHMANDVVTIQIVETSTASNTA